METCSVQSVDRKNGTWKYPCLSALFAHLEILAKYLTNLLRKYICHFSGNLLKVAHKKKKTADCNGMCIQLYQYYW